MTKTNINLDKKIPLLNGLKEYSKRDLSCFDVPGHTKDSGVEILNRYFGSEFMKMDINSSPLMDNVSNPYGIIKDAQKLLAKAYFADEAFFITNGTTGAIHAMILSVIKPNDKILLPRNIHKSVINAIILSGAIPIFINPKFNYDFGISANIDYKDVEDIIEKEKDIKAIFILNPTYYGMCSDLEKITNLCHKNNILVLVDEAHGAHFPFNKNLPKSSMMCGADMSAVSVHKTGGALTQASALLVNKRNINPNVVLQCINMIQSTSSSYILMSSIDGARYNMEINGEKQLSNALSLSRYAKDKLKKIKGVKILEKENQDGLYEFDETKICINFKECFLTGFDVYNMLYKNFNVQVELADLYNILVLISIGTTKKDIERLIDSIGTIISTNNKRFIGDIKIKPIIPKVVLSPRDAFYKKKQSVLLKDSLGKISAESIMAYPPGIPIISPGELITSEIIDYINILKDNNAYLTDMSDKNLENILIVKE